MLWTPSKMFSMVFFMFSPMELLLLLAMQEALASSDATTWQVLQQGEPSAPALYLFPHQLEGHPARAALRSKIPEQMRSCNRNSTRLIHVELCKLRKAVNLSVIFVKDHVQGLPLSEDGCFLKSWQERYLKHLDRKNIDLKTVDCEIQSSHARALDLYHLPNPYGLFALQHPVRVCPLLVAAADLDLDVAEEALRDCEAQQKECRELRRKRDEISRNWDSDISHSFFCFGDGVFCLFGVVLLI